MPSQSRNTDFIVVGAGIFGLTAALELVERGHSVTLLNEESIPSAGAASNDISKIVRMEYGSDELYMDMARQCMETWREWNDKFDKTLYHESGFLILSRTPMEGPQAAFEWSSYRNLLKRGLQPERLDAQTISSTYPFFAKDVFVDGFYHARGGFANASETLISLAGHGKSLGLVIAENERVIQLIQNSLDQVTIKTAAGNTYTAKHCVIAAGSATQILVPELRLVMKATAHPVFHIEIKNAEGIGHYPTFAADISNTGWYGFPPHPASGVIKIANHGTGQELDPIHDERLMNDNDRARFRGFVTTHLQRNLDYEVVYERKCLYSDTFDGHFLIDRHPQNPALTIAAGGSGHGFKMGPVLGRIIADSALGIDHGYDRFKWRAYNAEASNEEEARNL